MCVCRPTEVHTVKHCFPWKAGNTELYVQCSVHWGFFCPGCDNLYICHLTVIYFVLPLSREIPMWVAHKEHPNLWDTSCHVSHTDTSPALTHCVGSQLYICVNVHTCLEFFNA